MTAAQLTRLNGSPDVKKLSFNVKLGPRLCVLLLALPALLSCGYRPVYAAREPQQCLSVVAGDRQTAHAAALEGALEGARRALAEETCVGHGREHPRLVIEITRVDERAAGISAQGGQPLARGARVSVVGRAWVETKLGGAPERVTGDRRRSELYGASDDLRADTRDFEVALHAAGVKLGASLARAALGLPEPGLEPL
jgi:hypothetical protein